MKSAVDTNVLIALWDEDDSLNTVALAAFERAQALGGLVVPAPVYAELMALPGRTETFLDQLFADTGIYVDWRFEEKSGAALATPSNLTCEDARGSPLPSHGESLPIS